MFSGTHRGSSAISGGNAGIRFHGQNPNSANHTCVNTRAASTPPCSRTHSAAVRMCAASAGSPARRSAQ